MEKLKENEIINICTDNYVKISNTEKSIKIVKDILTPDEYKELNKQILESDMPIENKSELLNKTDKDRSKSYRRKLLDITLSIPVAIGVGVSLGYLKKTFVKF